MTKLRIDGRLTEETYHSFKSNGFDIAFEKYINSKISNEFELLSIIDIAKTKEFYQNSIIEKSNRFSSELGLIYKFNCNILGYDSKLQPIISPFVMFGNHFSRTRNEGESPNTSFYEYISLQPGFSASLMYSISDNLGIELECPVVVNITTWQSYGARNSENGLNNYFWPNIYYFKLGLMYLITNNLSHPPK